MHDVIVVGGGFAGVTAAREAALRGRSVLLLEARDRLGGRTWTAEWAGTSIEFGGAWVHWHQPHTWSEITRAGLEVALSDDADVAGWYVGDERRSAAIAERDAIARRGWDSFVDGVEAALPKPHDPLSAIDELVRFDRMSIAERLDELALDRCDIGGVAAFGVGAKPDQKLRPVVEQHLCVEVAERMARPNRVLDQRLAARVDEDLDAARGLAERNRLEFGIVQLGGELD